MDSFKIASLENIGELDCKEEYKLIVEELLTKLFRDCEYPVTIEIDESKKESKYYPVIQIILKGSITTILLDIAIENSNSKIKILRIKNNEKSMELKIIEDDFSCYYVGKDNGISFAGTFVEPSVVFDKFSKLFDLLENFQQISTLNSYSYKDFLKRTLNLLNISDLFKLFKDFSISDEIFRGLNGEIREAKMVTDEYMVQMDYDYNLSYQSEKIHYEIDSEEQICSLKCERFSTGVKCVMALLEEAHSRVLSFLQELAELENARMGQ